MAYNFTINMEDGQAKPIKRRFQMVEDVDVATDAANAGALLDAYATLTDCAVLSGSVTKTQKFAASGNTPTAAAAGARRWHVARISVSLTPTTDGIQSVGTFEVPAPKAAYISGGSVVDDGTIATFLANFLSTGNGRMADGQYVNSTSIIGGTVFSKSHPDSEN